MSILYFLVDFECFIDLDIMYPDNSWIVNYYQLMRESFEHDTPLQALEVGESCTVAASTSKMYVWGLNQEFKTLDNYAQVKIKQPVETFHIEKNSLKL